MAVVRFASKSTDLLPPSALPRSKSRHKGVISTLLGLYGSSMSAKPPLKSLQPQWLADEIRQQLLKAAGLYEDADVITE